MTRISSPTPFPSQSSQRAATSSDGEASGLIDIRTMGALIAATDERLEPLNFGGLTVTPIQLTPPTRPVTGSVAAVQRSQTPLFALLGALTLGVIGLAGYVVTRPPPQQQIVHVVKSDALASAGKIQEREPTPAEEVVAAEPVADEPAPPEVKPGKERSKPVKSGKPGPASKPAAVQDKPAPVVVPDKPKDYGVDCILGNASCGTKREDPPPVEAAPVDSLPEKLEQSDISAGTGAARSAAQSSCARFARGGEKVQIKLSIAGPTGSVIGASAVEDAGNPQLAACCAGELKQASFRKVRKQQFGTVVTVKF